MYHRKLTKFNDFINILIFHYKLVDKIYSPKKKITVLKQTLQEYKVGLVEV